MRQKVFDHAPQVGQHIVVPVTDDSDILVPKPTRAMIIRVLPCIRVLPTIDFNSEAKTGTVKVQRIRPDRMLPSELETVDLTSTKCLP